MGRLACNPLALVNDPTGSGHEPNVFAVMAWSRFTEEVNMYYIVKKEGVQKGQELWLDYGPVSFTALPVRPLRRITLPKATSTDSLQSSPCAPVSCRALSHQFVSNRAA